MGAIIEIRELTHTYASAHGHPIRALDKITFSVEQGEFLAVIGPNGSGKSTLAKHLNALLLPTEGRVWVKGIDTADKDRLWEIRQTVGMVFQNPDNQIVATIVEEDVAFGPENLGLPPELIRARVEEALTMVGMSSYRAHAPHLLSGGQKQRVAIAGIVAMRPAIVVMDEATAMLDPQGRMEVMETIHRLHAEGITVVLITHHMNEAVQADRVLVMDKGRMVAMGSAREIFTQVDLLRTVGLDVPQVTELAWELKREGLLGSADVLTVEEMVKLLCPSV